MAAIFTLPIMSYYLVETISTHKGRVKLSSIMLSNFLTFQFVNEISLMHYKVNIQLHLQIDKVTVEGMRKGNRVKTNS